MSYVDEAKRNIEELYQDKSAKITTSQIRNLLAGISDIYNDVVLLRGNELTNEIKDKILYLKVQFVYTAGRDKTKVVKQFVDKTNLLAKIDNAIKGKKEFLELEKYMEALVAFHRFYGGKDL